MRKETDRHLKGKNLSFNLPHIRPARSLPAIPPLKEFDLRLANIHMPSYKPEKDKFLSQYFQRQHRIKTLPSQNHSHQKSLKTEPTTLRRDGRSGEKPYSGKLKKMQAIPSGEGLKSRADNLKELSKQQFNSFLQSMKDKITHSKN